ncbi:MAG: hypothetical protein AAF772_16325, partial [Acidobacteriota bacterium]
GLLLVGLGVVAMFYVTIHLDITRTGYDIDTLQKTLHAREQAVRRLRVAVERLEHPTAIRARAIETLGMAPPADGQLLPARALLTGVQLLPASAPADGTSVPARTLAGSEIDGLRVDGAMP